MADFNRDGKPDLIWAYNLGTGILAGNGDGTFQASRVISSGNGVSGTQPLAIGDFNGDGIPDVALAQQFPPRVVILLGRGDFTFQTGVTLNTATIPEMLAAGDFNGDGNLDLLVMEQGTLSLYLGAGDGNFRPPVGIVTGTFLFGVAVGDFNGDGKADFAVLDGVGSGVGGVKILLGNGDGTFRAPVLFDAVYARGLVVADFDHDGLDDLAFGTLYDVGIILGTRDGAMRFNGWLFPNSGSGLLAKGDFNGDGNIDLVAGTNVLLGAGNGSFAPPIYYPRSQDLSTVVEGDFNGDGRTDIVVGESSGITILYGVSGSMTASGTPQSALLGMAFGSPLAVSVKDASGNPVSGVTVTYFSGTGGAGAVLSSSTAVTNAAGVASVTATANNTAGSYTVWASAGTITAGFYLTNTADLPASLSAVSGTPQSVAAGMPFNASIEGRAEELHGAAGEWSGDIVFSASGYPPVQHDRGDGRLGAGPGLGNRRQCAGNLQRRGLQRRPVRNIRSDGRVASGGIADHLSQSFHLRPAGHTHRDRTCRRQRPGDVLRWHRGAGNGNHRRTDGVAIHDSSCLGRTEADGTVQRRLGSSSHAFQYGDSDRVADAEFYIQLRFRDSHRRDVREWVRPVRRSYWGFQRRWKSGSRPCQSDVAWKRRA